MVQEIERVVAERIRVVELVRRAAVRARRDLAVLGDETVERPVPLADAPFARPLRAKAEDVLKAAAARHLVRLSAEMPFARHVRSVAVRVEELGDRRVVVASKGRERIGWVGGGLLRVE